MHNNQIIVNSLFNETVQTSFVIFSFKTLCAYLNNEGAIIPILTTFKFFEFSEEYLLAIFDNNFDFYKIYSLSLEQPCIDINTIIINNLK